MWKIKPVGAAGEPVEILEVHGQGAKYDLTINCEGMRHRVTFNGAKILTPDHGPDIEIQKIAVALGAGCPCVRIEQWMKGGGIIMFWEAIS